MSDAEKDKGIIRRPGGKIFTPGGAAAAHVAEALFDFHRPERVIEREARVTSGAKGFARGRTLSAEDAREVYGGTLGM